MRTAKEMYDHCNERKLLGGMNKRTMKDFQIIEKNLMADEVVIIAFSGISNYVNMKNNEGSQAYAITNKRIMRGLKEFIFGEKFMSVSLKYLNDISFDGVTGSGILDNGVITFDTMKETFSVCSGREQMQKLFNDIQELIYNNEIKEDIPTTSNIDEIRKYKELLDDGIITEEEFEGKKKELLKL